MACKVPPYEWVERPGLLILVCSSWFSKWLSTFVQMGYLWRGTFSIHYKFLCKTFSPHFSFVIFFPSISQLACNGSCVGSSDGISPIYSLWATFIGLYIANYVVERSTGWVANVQLILLFYCCWLFSLDISRIFVLKYRFWCQGFSSVSISAIGFSLIGLYELSTFFLFFNVVNLLS